MGYDLYHPHITVVWHEYTREYRTKHWTDFNKENQEKGLVERPWWEMDNDSKRRLRHMLQEEDNNIDLGEYGLGDVRTHRDYELYAGINFKNRRLHPMTLRGVNPPINDNSDWDKIEEVNYSYTIDIPETKDFKFIYIAVEDDKGSVLFRKDLTEYTPKLDLNFKCYEKPHKWIYWVMNKNDIWVDRIDTLL